MKVSANFRASLSSLASASRRSRSTRSILFRTSHFGAALWASCSMSASTSSSAPLRASTMSRRDRRPRRRAKRARDHRAVEPALGRENAGRVDEDDLRLALDRDAAHLRARRLHLARDDRDLGADERVDQRRLAGVRARRPAPTKPQRVEGASASLTYGSEPSVSMPSRCRKDCAAACSAARFEVPAPDASSKPSTVDADLEARRVVGAAAAGEPV